MVALRREGLVGGGDDAADQNSWEKVGAVLCRHAASIDAAVHGASTVPRQTIIMGDAKAANLFFRPPTGNRL